MKKQSTLIACVLFILIFSTFAYAENEDISPLQDELNLQENQETTSITESVPTTSQTEIKQEDKNEEVNFDVDPGITPDSFLYFVDEISEKVSVGNNPERALDYKEEKIAEAIAMVESEKPEEAQIVLDKALEYNDIVEREVSPDIQQRVERSAERVQSAINNMRQETKGEQWRNVNNKLDENVEKEKKVETAAELASKIDELCDTLAKLDPLQYSDSCKPKGDSPKWMKEKDKGLTKEQEAQAQVFFDKLSSCFDSPENCDCKGMGVQSFEDFCLEKSALAVKCKKGDKIACSELESGSDPSELLPDYLIPVLNKVEGKYSKAEMDLYMPDECREAGVKSAEDCNQLMFKLNAPEECIDAGITGKSRQDEIECKDIMFEKNSPQECIDAGITGEDKDAPRKCAQLMFKLRAPEECIDAGITGERRDDEKRCREIAGSKEIQQGAAPKFSRDCNSIQESNEKMKCYEEFYNSAQMQIKEDFRDREFADKIGAANPNQPCPDNVCDDFEKRNPDACPEDCGGIRNRCQSQEQINRLSQDCKDRGQDAKVENRGGCPWVICIGQENQNSINQQQNQYVTGDKSGIKCPDAICDSYEKMNPYACPEDCGGRREDYRPPENRIDQPQNRIDQPQQPQFCSGQAPSCTPNGAPFCENGNWRCPEQTQEQQPMQPPQQIEPQPTQPAQPVEQTAEQPQTSPSSGSETTPTESTPASEPSTPITGGVITGRIIISNYGDENTRDGDSFLDYWFMR